MPIFLNVFSYNMKSFILESGLERKALENIRIAAEDEDPIPRIHTKLESVSTTLIIPPPCATGLGDSRAL